MEFFYDRNNTKIQKDSIVASIFESFELVLSGEYWNMSSSLVNLMN